MDISTTIKGFRKKTIQEISDGYYLLIYWTKSEFQGFKSAAFIPTESVRLNPVKTV